MHSDYKISIAENVTLVTLNNMVADSREIASVFSAIAKDDINVDMISQTAPMGGNISLSFTFSDNDLSKVLSIIGKFKEPHRQIKTEVSSDNAKISIFNSRMLNESGVAGSVFSAVANCEAQIKLITTSEVDISILVDKFALESVLEQLEHYL